MRLACLLKAVPEREEMPIDLPHGTVDRSATALLLNPFDARAIGVALVLRRPGEEIVAISMGPPTAAAVLREALAAGVDRALLVTDPALPASDTLATSVVLAQAVRRLGAGLVIAGAASTDSGTGEVPPEVAARLDWPIVSESRSVAWEPDGQHLIVVREAPGGWERVRTPAPSVLSVGEKILKPPKPTDAARAEAERAPVERWSLAELGLPPERVGLSGSPTRVVRIVRDAPGRAGRIFGEGPIEERVRGATMTLDRLPRPVPPSEAFEPARATLGPLWVLATDGEGRLEPAAESLLAEVPRRLGRRAELVAIGVGPAPPREAVELVQRAGADRWLGVDAGPGPWDPRRRARALGELRSAGPAPAALILVSDTEGRELAGLLAAELGLGLVGDATGFRADGDGTLRWTKPSFGGDYLAEIGVTGATTVATIRPGTFAAATGEFASARCEVERRTVARAAPAIERLDRGMEGDPLDGELGSASVVVTVGMGVGGPDGIDAVRTFARSWGAAMGATRRVVDAGWLPAHRQVGLTGRAIAPDLAVLVGVGKGPNHAIGVRRARRILAINPDPTAGVFRYADAGIVGGWQEILPMLDRWVRALRPSGPSAA